MKCPLVTSVKDDHISHFSLQHSLDGDVDVTFEYILPACARISSVLGAGFTQFLPFVMDPLLKGAMQEIQFSMVDADVDDTEGEVLALPSQLFMLEPEIIKRENIFRSSRTKRQGSKALLCRWEAV